MPVLKYRWGHIDFLVWNDSTRRAAHTATKLHSNSSSVSAESEEEVSLPFSASFSPSNCDPLAFTDCQWGFTDTMPPVFGTLIV